MTVLPATGWNELIWATDSLAAKRKDWHGIGVLFPALGVGFGVLLCFISFGVRNANLPYVAPAAGLCLQQRNVKEMNFL